MKKLLLLFLLALNCFFVNAQYKTVFNYATTTTFQNGTKIKTNIPYGDGYGMPCIKIEGYDFEKALSLDLFITFYIYNNTFYNASVSTSGGSNPEVWLCNENGKVTILLAGRSFHNRFVISAYWAGQSTQDSHFTGWTIIDEGKKNGGSEYFL